MRGCGRGDAAGMTAPLDASSGEQIRHRLSRAGNRKMNHMLHIAAATQVRLDTEGRSYYRRRLAEGKTRMDAMRCLKRRISGAVYRQLLADPRVGVITAENAEQDQTAAEVGTGPGGHSGGSHESSAVDLPPHIDTLDQPLPGPAQPTLKPASDPERSRQPGVSTAPVDNRGVPIEFVKPRRGPWWSVAGSDLGGRVDRSGGRGSWRAGRRRGGVPGRSGRRCVTSPRPVSGRSRCGSVGA